MMKRVLLMMCMVLSATVLFAQTTYYVKTDGDNTKDGTSWENAKKDITSMVSAIADPASSQVFVKGGTYNISASITLNNTKNGLKLYGGFAGTETCLCDRTFADSTVLDGGNSVRIISNSGVTGAVWDGFTLTKGKAANGGGMNFGSSANVSVANCIFKENQGSSSSGGAVYASSSTVKFTDCKFISNTAYTAGGAIIISSGASGELERCVFDLNFATTTNGGAVSTYNTGTATTIKITDCIFARNESVASTGGALHINASVNINVSGCIFTDNTAATHGGGINNHTSSNATITNCTFTSNTATLNGGGIYNNTSSTPTITNCTFEDNEAKNTTTGNGGGAIFITEANSTITYCYFRGNKATNSGGAIAMSSTTTKFVNCLFSGNKAGNAGGAAYITNATGKTCTPTFLNCTIAGNSAPTTGGAIYNTGNSSTNTIVTNCIVWGNSSGITNSVAAVATATVTYSNVQYTNAVPNAAYPEADYSGADNNINADPMFSNSPAFGGAPFITGNYALTSYSANAVNKGLNSAINGYNKDITGIADRIYDGTVDMGAYELQGTLPVTVNSFTANLVNNRTQLKWNVGTESNVNRYEVERSQNGIDFITVAKVSANGSSSYFATDANPELGINYYRLLSIDNDGTTVTFKELQTVRVASLATESAQVSPNPVKDNVINVTLNGYATGNYAYKLVNAAGATVQQGNVNYTGSNVTIATTIPTGVYVLYLSNGANVVKTKLVKQ